MLIIRSDTDIETADLPAEHTKLLLNRWQSLKPIISAGEGGLVYLHPSDIEQPLSALGLHYRLEEMGFDGISFHSKSSCYELICITNNSWGWNFIVPHSNTLNPETLPWLADLLADGGLDAG